MGVEFNHQKDKTNERLRSETVLNEIARYKVEYDLTYHQLGYRFNKPKAYMSLLANNKKPIPKEILDRLKELKAAGKEGSS
jgi:hypothetical protein